MTTDHGLSYCPACGEKKLEYYFDYCTCNGCKRAFRIKPTIIRIEDESETIQRRYGIKVEP